MPRRRCAKIGPSRPSAEAARSPAGHGEVTGSGRDHRGGDERRCDLRGAAHLHHERVRYGPQVMPLAIEPASGAGEELGVRDHRDPLPSHRRRLGLRRANNGSHVRMASGDLEGHVTDRPGVSVVLSDLRVGVEFDSAGWLDDGAARRGVPQTGRVALAAAPKVRLLINAPSVGERQEAVVREIGKEPRRRAYLPLDRSDRCRRCGCRVQRRAARRERRARTFSGRK